MHMKTAGIVAIGLALLAAAAIAADYAGLFGTRRQAFVDYVDVRFQPVEKASGRPIRDVHITCFRKGSEHACSERMVHGQETIHAKFAALMVRTRSWLFTRGTIVGDPDMRVHVMFIHPDYDRVTRTFTVADLVRLEDREVRVEMPQAGH